MPEPERPETVPGPPPETPPPPEPRVPAHAAAAAGAAGGVTVDALPLIERDVVACRLCPRLVAWREEVGRVKRRAYRDRAYWAKPVPGFGDREARLVIVGLAPGAHGANRTGRMFTGDASGDFLYAALWRAGLASHPESRSRDDGLVLRGCWINAAVRCVPPNNRPTPRELDHCSRYLDRELDVLRRARVVLALGAIAFDGYLGYAARRGVVLARPRPRFAHGLVIERGLPHTLISSYHVSRQNTQTGRLTAAMFDKILEQAWTKARRTGDR